MDHTALLFRGATLLDHRGILTPDTDLLVEEGHIRAMGRGLEPGDAQVVDCTGMVLSPGLPVLHAHSPMHILRGLAEDVTPDAWFNEEIWPYESKITPEDIYWGSRLCAAEMADCGVTAFADHYFQAREVIRAAGDTGLRVNMAPTAFGLDRVEKDIAETLTLREDFSANSLVKITFGPHAPYTCGPQALAQVAQAAREAGMGLHLHLAETKEQQEESLRLHGKTPAGVVAEAGGFQVPCIVAHGLWMAPEDVPLLGKDTFVAVSPKTYMKLGMGTGTLWDQWDRLNLCIGTDGAASSNTVNPLEQARLFALLGKLPGRAGEFRLQELWQLLMNGHRALGFGTGRLEPGAPADLVVWDLNTPNTAPVYNPLAAILYSADRGNVLHTVVAGRFVKRDGRLVQDTAPLLAEAARCAQALSIRGKGVSRLFF